MRFAPLLIEDFVQRVPQYLDEASADDNEARGLKCAEDFLQILFAVSAREDAIGLSDCSQNVAD